MLILKEVLKAQESELCLSPDDIKVHLMIPHSLHDAQLNSILRAGIKNIEHETGRKFKRHLCTTTFKITDKVYDYTYLRYGEIDIQYVINNKTQQHIDPAKYLFSPMNSKFILDTSTINVDEIQIQYLCGYSYMTVPEDLAHAIKMFASTLYMNKSNQSSDYIRTAVLTSNDLIRRYKLRM